LEFHRFIFGLKSGIAFDDFSLIELIVERGQDAFDKVPEKMRRNKEAMAETIENNLRKVIIEESPTNPAYYEKMSTVLDELIKITQTKFIIVTHHALTMSKMNKLYGVTMAEKGVSQLVAVDLEKAEEMVA